MNRKEFWCQVYLKNGADCADDALEDYDERWGRQNRNLTRDDFPTVSDFEEGVYIEGCKFFSHWNDGLLQYEIKASKDGVTGLPRYTNTRQEGDLRIWLEEQGHDVITEMIKEFE